MTPYEFITKWRASELKESSASQEHFINLCGLLGEPTPAEADPTGDHYCFERGARKDTGGDGWADVWKRHCFAWEYKGKHADLDAAFAQLRQYALALENPPLLIVSDMARFRIRTNWTNSVSEKHEFTLDDLADATVRDKLKWAMSDPDRLRPGESRQALTERAAETFASLAQSLRERGHDPQAVAHFVNRLVFCMFAEDVGLLADNIFTRMLEHAHKRPEDFAALARDLFGAMATGGRIGFEAVAWFNGGLFDDDTALPLDKTEIDTTLKASSLDWSEIDPSILGTLFERGLDPDKRSQLGAHYTDRDKIMRIIEPVVVRPWLAEWETAKAEIAAGLERADAAKSRPARTRQHRQAEHLLRSFLERLRDFTVLDPACGSGNFLYLALHALKDLEHRMQLEGEALGLQRAFPAVGPANVKGIEINAYAAELARVSVWIGEIQWMRRNGFPESRDPILKPLDTIECRDAILTPDNTEPDWPEADVVIGNPPFVWRQASGPLARRGVRVPDVFAAPTPSRVSGAGDLVCYWFEKAGRQIASGKAKLAGLVATNSIRGGANRPALQAATTARRIFEAWSDEPWVIDGAAVRVSLICFSRGDDDVRVRASARRPARRRDLRRPDRASRPPSALTSRGCSAFPRTLAWRSVGDQKGGPFDIEGSQAREWLRLPCESQRPDERGRAEAVGERHGPDPSAGREMDRRLRVDDVRRRRRAVRGAVPVGEGTRLRDPMRSTARARRPIASTGGGTLGPTTRDVGKRSTTCTRYIATPRVAKYRLFVWLDARVCPDSATIAIARDDDTTFGILHSRFHEIWSLRLGTSLEDRPRYTPTTTFETFPFPRGLTPDILVADYADDPRSVVVALEAQRLVALRDRWLNPPEWVEWVDEPVPGYPKRPVPRDEDAAKALKKRTLTNLYNARPQWLADAHEALDAAVAAAYGWPADISDDEVLRELLALNGDC